MSAAAAGEQRAIEIELARDLLAGKPEAFDRFVEIFRSKLFRYTYLVCGQREDAEEVAQETLLKAFERFRQLREPEHIRSWMFTIARNECMIKRRKSLFAPDHEVSLDEPGEARGVADSGSGPDEECLRAELREVLREAVASLPESYRPVLLLRDVEELSTAETADVLGLSEDVIKQRLHRARVMLREKLTRRVFGKQPVEAAPNASPEEHLALRQAFLSGCRSTSSPVGRRV